MKKLITVKKHLRKGKVVKSHTRKASKQLKRKYAALVSGTSGIGQVSEGRAKLKRAAMRKVDPLAVKGKNSVLKKHKANKLAKQSLSLEEAMYGNGSTSKRSFKKMPR